MKRWCLAFVLYDGILGVLLLVDGMAWIHDRLASRFRTVLEN